MLSEKRQEIVAILTSIRISDAARDMILNHMSDLEARLAECEERHESARSWKVWGDDLRPVMVHRLANLKGADWYAVRQGAFCLDKRGKWEHEPIPSSRTDAFYRRCRWATFEDAWKAAAEAELEGADE